MVGKTPEFMSMKISPRDIKLAVFIFLSHPALILIPAVIAFSTGNAQVIIGDRVTPLGFTQTLYEFTSAASNNGSDYFRDRGKYSLLELVDWNSCVTWTIPSDSTDAGYCRFFYTQG